MGKEKFQRNHIHDKFLERVIVRLDFTGARDINKMHKLFEEQFPKTFKKSQDLYMTSVSFKIPREDIEYVSKTIDIPLNIMEKTKILHYEGMRGVQCEDVKFDISQYFICMMISCNENYEGLDAYLECFKGAATLFGNEFEYFCPKRLGLRKIRREIRPKSEEFEDLLEHFAFTLLEYTNKNLGNNILYRYDHIEVQNTPIIKCNIKRRIEHQVERQSAGGYGDKYVSILDIDTYYREEKLKNINALLNDANLLEFDIYKHCMKEEYLQGICY